jgi:Tfp pilus assembly protein PilF
MGREFGGNKTSQIVTKRAVGELPGILAEAIALHRSGRLASARANYEAILEVQPGHFDALHLLGVIAAQTKEPARAVELIGKAIEVDPRNPAAFAAHANLGSALQELGRLDAAIASYDRAVALNANHAEAHSNRGAALRRLRRFDEALISINRATDVAPEYAAAHSNRGNVFGDLGQWNSALDSYNRAIALKSDFAEAHNNRATVFLRLGEFEKGWPEFEWRWKDPGGTNILEKRNFRQPLWLGESPIAGKTILLHCEQGLGDTFQFCRYVKMVADLGARVILEVQQPQVGLLSTLEGLSRIVQRGSTLPDFDFQCPLMSLPLAFKTKLDTIPSASRYIRSDPGKVIEWQARLGEKTRRRIGLVWSGNPLHRNNPNRSFRLADLIRYLPDGYQYFSLQKEIPEQDRQSLEANAGTVTALDGLHDFSDTAALCDSMDLVISTDTSVAHLSGALGRETWILLAFNADWRWLLDRADSPWYPTAELHRQERFGEWQSIFERIREALIARLDSG